MQRNKVHIYNVDLIFLNFHMGTLKKEMKTYAFYMYFIKQICSCNNVFNKSYEMDFKRGTTTSFYKSNLRTLRKQ